MSLQQVASSPQSSTISSLKTPHSPTSSEDSLTRSSSKTSLTTLSYQNEFAAGPDGGQKPLISIGTHLVAKDEDLPMTDDKFDSLGRAKSASMIAAIQPLVDKFDGVLTDGGSAVRLTQAVDGEPLAVKIEHSSADYQSSDQPEPPGYDVCRMSHWIWLLLVVELLLLVYLSWLSMPVEGLLTCLVAVHLVSSKARIWIHAHALRTLDHRLESRDIRLTTSVLTEWCAMRKNAEFKTLLLLTTAFIDLAVAYFVELEILPSCYAAALPILHALVPFGELYARCQSKLWVIPLYVNNTMIESLGDTGADGNLMALHVALFLGLGINEKHKSCRWRPDGSCYWTLGTVDVSIKFPRHVSAIADRVQFHVVDMPASELTLGFPFLQAHDMDRVDHPRSVQRHRHLWEIGQNLLVTVQPDTTNTFNFLPLTVARLCRLNAMIDTGAGVNAISAQSALTILLAVPFSTAVVRQHKTVLRFVVGKPFIVRYVLELELWFGNTRTTETFVVIPHLLHDIIVGEHFCTEFEKGAHFKNNKFRKQVTFRGVNGPVDAGLQPLGPGQSAFETVKAKVKSMLPGYRQRKPLTATQFRAASSQEYDQSVDHFLAMCIQRSKQLHGRLGEDRAAVEAFWTPRIYEAKAEAERKREACQIAAGTVASAISRPRLAVVDTPALAGIEEAVVAGALHVSEEDAMAVITVDQTQTQSTIVASNGIAVEGHGQDPVTANQQLTPSPNNVSDVRASQKLVSDSLLAAQVHREVTSAAVTPPDHEYSATAGPNDIQSASQAGTESVAGHFLMPMAPENGESSAGPSTRGPSSINEAPQQTPGSSVSPVPSINASSETDEHKLTVSQSQQSTKPISPTTTTPSASARETHSATS